MQDDRFSPASACNYDFEFPNDAKLGDIIVVEIEGLSNLNFYFARGLTKDTSKGRLVEEPKAALIKSRFPDAIYLTLLNKDIE